MYLLRLADWLSQGGTTILIETNKHAFVLSPPPPQNLKVVTLIKGKKTLPAVSAHQLRLRAHRRDQTHRSTEQKRGWLAGVRSVQRTTPKAEGAPLLTDHGRPVPAAPLGRAGSRSRLRARCRHEPPTGPGHPGPARPRPVPGLAAQQRPGPPASCGSRASVCSPTPTASHTDHPNRVFRIMLL
jgi:hypothetical protein